MLSRRLRRTIGSKAATQRFAERPAGPIKMATVTEVIPGDGTPGSAYATVELSDGTETTLYPTGGYLPAVGDQVPAIANGGDLVAFTTRQMVDGDMQSRTWAGVDGPPGWMLTADGILYAVSGHFSGTVEATEFRVVDSLGAVRMVIDEPDFGPAVIAFYTGVATESIPGLLGRSSFGGLTMISSTSAGGAKSGLNVRRSSTGGGTRGTAVLYANDDGNVNIVEMTVLPDDILVNVNGSTRSLLTPPTFHAGRTTVQSPSASTWQALTHTTVHKNRGFTIVGTNQYRPDTPGRYRATATVEWTGGTYWAGTRISKNGTGIGGAFAAGTADFRGVGHSITDAIHGASQVATETFTLNGTSDYLQVAGYPSVGGENATMLDLLIEYVGPL
ncbi:MAG TPA: hypothetical protein VHK88_19920 [Aquihabitans sp.]|jgi:hypothetical protein|nr:hypothetical protein [Aquihabitans sp.]